MLLMHMTLDGPIPVTSSSRRSHFSDHKTTSDNFTRACCSQFEKALGQSQTVAFSGFSIRHSNEKRNSTGCAALGTWSNTRLATRLTELSGFLRRLLFVDHGVDEAVGIEDGQIVDAFTETDVLDRDAHRLANRDDDSAFG